MKRTKKITQKGEGESGVLILVLSVAIAISVIYFAIGWIKHVKDARAGYGKQEAPVATPPKSLEEMGDYEVHY